MEGVVTSNSKISFTAVFANFHHLPIRLTTNDKVGRLNIDEQMTTYPIDNCLAIQDGKPIITNPVDFHHVDKIPFDHIPLIFQQDYRAILRSYADVFLKNDLNLGHCKALPHQVQPEQNYSPYTILIATSSKRSSYRLCKKASGGRNN